MKYEIGTEFTFRFMYCNDVRNGEIIDKDVECGTYTLKLDDGMVRTVSDILFSQCAQVTKLPKPDFTVSEKDEGLFVPDSEKPTVLHVILNSSALYDLNHVREKMGREPLGTLESDKEISERFEREIEAKAEELYEIYSDKYQTALEQKILCGWMNQSGHLREGFRAIARHLSTPQTDVQKALDEALKSEHELRAELEAHQHNSKQILRLNNWLQENNLVKPGVSVTDRIIELLGKSAEPKQPDEPRVVINDSCEYTYEQLRGAGWVDDQMVEHGYAKWLPQPQSFQSRVMDAIHIKSELRSEMTEDRIIENLESLHRDAAEGESFRKFAINNLDFGPHIKPNQLRVGLSKRHKNYKSMQKALKEISVVIKTV